MERYCINTRGTSLRGNHAVTQPGSQRGDGSSRSCLPQPRRSATTVSCAMRCAVAAALAALAPLASSQSNPANRYQGRFTYPQ